MKKMQDDIEDDASMWSSECVPYNVSDAEDTDFEAGAEELLTSDNDNSTLLQQFRLLYAKQTDTTSSPSNTMVSAKPTSTPTPMEAHGWVVHSIANQCGCRA